MILGGFATRPRLRAALSLAALLLALTGCGSKGPSAATGLTKAEAADARSALELLGRTGVPQRVVAISYQSGQAPTLCSVVPTALPGTFQLVVAWDPTTPAFATQAKNVLEATISSKSLARDQYAITTFGGAGGKPEPTDLKAELARAAVAPGAARCVALQSGDLEIQSQGSAARPPAPATIRASSLHLAAPWLLLLLLAIPAGAACYEALDRRRMRRAAAWSTKGMLPNLVQRPVLRSRRAPRVLFLIGLACLIIGLARPQRVAGSTTRTRPTVVLAFDTSGSMAARDVRPSRLGEARALATSFLRRLPRRYEVGIVTFANSVHLAIPPTLERAAAIEAIPGVVTPRAGTALGDGITYAVALAGGASVGAPGAESGGGVVLLFSDGVQTSSGTTPAQAEVSAVEAAVPVDTVALGTANGSVIQPETVAGVRTAATLPVPAEPQAMRMLAAQTSGIALTPSSLSSPAEIRKVYENLDAFTTTSRQTDSLSWIAASVAFVFMLGGAALSAFELGRLV
jgi:Ca-activated chloride channel family protein